MAISGLNDVGAGADPITLEVIRNAVYSIAEEMSVVLTRSARSPVLKEAGDLSCVITDATGRIIAQGKDIPIHLGVMAFTVKALLERIPAERWQEGDVYFLNHVEVGGNHLPDVKAVRPIFWGERLIAFAVALAHWPDVGGGLPGSYVPFASDIWQEGLQITPLKLFDQRGPVAEHLDLVLANVRGREERLGDILAQVAACDVAHRRLLELTATYGPDVLLACVERFLAESEQRMRSEIRQLTPGTYVGEDYLDDDGHVDRPIKLRVAVTVDPAGELTFDFSGTDPQADGPINATYYVTSSGVFYACKALLGPAIAPNDGAYRPLVIRVPKGTVLNPHYGAPVVGGNHETSQRVVDVCLRALGQIVPERLVAGGMGSSGLALITGRQADGRPFFLYETHAGGEGATAARDGSNAIRVHMSNVMNTPIEVIETEYPLRVERCELRQGSGGRGRHRGGLGVRRAYRVLAPEARITTMIERRVVPPWGWAGGESGAPSRITVLAGAAASEMKGKESRVLTQGEVLVVETAGGGGYGPPEERREALDRRDLAEAYIHSKE